MQKIDIEETFARLDVSGFELGQAFNPEDAAAFNSVWSREAVRSRFLTNLTHLLKDSGPVPDSVDGANERLAALTGLSLITIERVRKGMCGYTYTSIIATRLGVGLGQMLGEDLTCHTRALRISV